MLERLAEALWKIAPRRLRWWSVRLTQPKFTVTAGAVIQDNEGRVLLVDHVFRKQFSWGIPGGFLNAGEQPEEAVRRELIEEIRLELETAEIALARTLARSQQIEIVFRCRPRGKPEAQGQEVRSAEWFALDSLPEGLSRDQRLLIRKALNLDGAGDAK